MKEITKLALDRHAMNGTPSGEFIEAVLCNDLKESFKRADEQNQADLFEIVKYCYNELPAMCWGSPEKVRAWQNIGGYEGFSKHDPPLYYDSQTKRLEVIQDGDTAKST
jgi:hypothetical protein